jgi:PAS domain S-box-containing protein
MSVIPSHQRLSRKQDDVEAAEQSFRQLVANVSDYGIYILDTNGRVTSWNLGAEKIKGYTAAEILGANFARFYTEEDVERGIPAANLKHALEKGHLEGEGWRVRKNGSRFWANIVITPLFSSEGRHIGFSKITRDLTAQQSVLKDINRRSEELEERTRQLQEANSALEAFTYSVSHDLRAPLRAMWGYATALVEDYKDRLDGTGQQYAAAIVDAAKRMDSLIEDLLSYSRLGRVEMQLGSVRLEDTVSDAVRQIEAVLTSSGAEIELVEPFSDVYGHHATLVQVLVNLLSNSLKFAQVGVKPKIRVSTESNDGNVRIWIADNGIGIAREHQQRIFQPFERLHGVESYPGTGIGLAVVRRGIERMGGQVGVESEPGRGSKFWIELPKGEQANPNDSVQQRVAS